MKYPLAYEPEILNHAKKYGHGMTNGNIAAIEFGTTVALAYIRRGDKEVSMLMLYKKNWGIRVPNTILLRKVGASLTTTTSIGEEAKNNYKIRIK